MYEAAMPQSSAHALSDCPDIMLETYVSTDIETDGPIAGTHSILSIGSAAFSPEGDCLGTFSVNLETLPEAAPDPRTMQWWATQREAWAACRQDSQDPARAIRTYLDWLRSLPGRPVFVAYPSAFDFPFVYWYLLRFGGENPFGYSAIDIKTYAMAILRRPYRQCGKKSMPAEWLSSLPHTHRAIDDALEQGYLFVNMLKHDGERRRA
jgi:DNA polymerase III alpha subunit (gram-positive type)